MLDFIRIACAVPKVRVGDVAANAAQVCADMDKADKAHADILLFPELSLTGYTCADLFFQDTLLASVKEGLRKIADHSAGLPELTAIVGLPLQIGTKLYNCAAVVAKGQVVGVVPKTHIPNHREFSEKRWFASGEELQNVWLTPSDIGLTASEDYWDVPVGTKQLFCVGGETVLGVEICEDLMVPKPVSADLAVHGAEVIVNLSASPEIVGKRRRRRELVAHQSGACSCVYAFASAGEGESTADLVFSGHSLVAENGTVLAESAVEDRGGYLLLCDCDLGRIRAERRQNQNFGAEENGQKDGYRTRNVFTPFLRADGKLYPGRKLVFVPDTSDARMERAREVFRLQVSGLKQRLEAIHAKAVIGISGGLDSTLALMVAVEANKQLGRPASDVHCVTMPCFGTSDRTYRNALALMTALGVTKKEIPIREAVLQHFRDIGHDPAVRNATYENAQARERTQVLMDYAGAVGGIVVGTGDLSELALGWCTYNADQMSMYGVNADVPKTLVRVMVENLAQEPAFRCAAGILRDIADTPISPELLPPDEAGAVSQRTEDLVGPYELHDFYLYHMLHFGFSPEKIFTLACRAFKEDYDRATVKKWLVVFYRRFFSQQFKRSCMPEGVKVGSVALSPRSDWKMPGDAVGRLWIEQTENLPDEE